ncbi:hypothetical protein Prudu_000726 [Prunus dulcis]|uniref:CCHC-type domain-containing protein n=1 Tax=Prunus dulcis TaxID=3755 RepID=A0A4Y1QM10_PRUDU|nr:hypothetical protein Prudu_000726 [Prunus dulcis]
MKNWASSFAKLEKKIAQRRAPALNINREILWVLVGIRCANIKMDQIAPCIHDELALFVKKYRRVVKDKTKVTRNCQNLPSSSTCVSQDNVFKEMNVLDSYGFREDKSLKGLVKCYLCGGAGHIDVECANNHMTESNGREESISAQWSDNDSDDSNNYITSSYEEANNFALVGSVHNSSLARVHDDQSYREHDDQSYKEQDDRSYLGMCEKYDVLFTETSKLKERNLLLEGKIKNLEILNCTFKEANNELSENVETLESERESLIVIKNDISNQVNVLKENNLIFQASNKNLLTQINEANDKVIKLTIGAKKVDKMLNMGKFMCSYFDHICQGVKYKVRCFRANQDSKIHSYLSPLCVKGHIRPRCNALRNVSRATNANGFKNHVSSLKTCELAKSVLCERDKHSSLAKFGFPNQKVNDDSLQTQVNDLLYKVVKIPKVISLPHKVSKVKQVWIKKEDHEFLRYGAKQTPYVLWKVGVPSSQKMGVSKPLSGCTVSVVDQDLLNQAHLYVLENTEEVLPYIEQHMIHIKTAYPKFRKRTKWLQDKHNSTFIQWLRFKVQSELEEDNNGVSENLRWLAAGPNMAVPLYRSYLIKGIKFNIKAQDDVRTTQNSGVYLLAQTMQVASAKDKNPILSNMGFYGVIQEIWDLDYQKFTIPVFRCDWIDSSGLVVDELGFTLVDLSKIGHRNDQFVLASQVKQIFFVDDPMHRGWSVVLSMPNREYNDVIGDEVLGDVIIECEPFTRGMPNVDTFDELVGELGGQNIRDGCEDIWIE